MNKEEDQKVKTNVDKKIEKEQVISKEDEILKNSNMDRIFSLARFWPLNIKKEKVEIEKKNYEELKLKLKETEDRVLRTLAENENLRKRHHRELEESRKYASKNFAFSLLTIADNFQRAMQSIPNDISEDNQSIQNLVEGIKAIEKEFYDIFEKNGIIAFSSVNKKFDPDLHQAVSQINSEIKEGLIVEELQQGFKIADRLLRPAMVVVSKGKQKK
ncbi:nucleotide exchange factor GrpE [Rickettsiales bacterium]|nr:nucleotide exchange factor GrpE [Rickettsiales bacterium]